MSSGVARRFVSHAAIFGLLAACLTWAILPAPFDEEYGFSSRGRARVDIAQLVSALNEYSERHHGTYPPALAALAEPDTLGQRYWKALPIPLDPWRNEYRYRPPPLVGALPLVWSLGCDAQDGSGDDLVSWKTLE